MAVDETITVEVAFALPGEQAIIEIQVPKGTTAERAVGVSGIRDRFPEIDLSIHRLGIFGKPVPRDHALLTGDRVEIYRQLIADPKEVRKRRAAQGKAMKKGGGPITGEKNSA
ncbi:MAG: RnfH family protein [Pseudomonadota bacterium]|nr:RnfH family protein [Pseudomonadota bacterium]